MMTKQKKNTSVPIRLFTLPNLLTLCNLICGCLAIVFVLHFDGLQMAFFMLLAAAGFDFLDGFMARLLQHFSALGKELDSLADMVSFGLAPAVILLSMFQSSGGQGEIGYGVFILTAFSALRLAKFNVDQRQTENFIGLPTPACALFVASSGYLFEQGIYTLSPWVILVVALLLGVLLISHIPMFSLKFKEYGFAENRWRYIFLTLSAIALLGFQVLALPFIIVGYILLSVVAYGVTPKSTFSK